MAKYLQIALLAIMAVVLITAVGCFGGKKEKRGINYMPDMYFSPALKSNEAYRIIERDEHGAVVRIREVSGMLPPPDGAIARNLIYSQPLGAWSSDAHAANANPLEPTPEVMRLGRVKYDAYCAVCHGRDGDVLSNYLGDKFAGIISLNIEGVAAMTDGHIYDVITHGIRRMPGYKAQLMPDERWAVIHYVRVLQDAAGLDEETRERLMEEERSGDFDAFAPPPEPIPEYLKGIWPEFQQ
ncbi:MAG: cytochrome c [Planctomycetota bacterium]|nr:MAG: cytochrome c [Planctomycetota bacterium]